MSQKQEIKGFSGLSSLVSNIEEDIISPDEITSPSIKTKPDSVPSIESSDQEKQAVPQERQAPPIEEESLEQQLTEEQTPQVLTQPNGSSSAKWFYWIIAGTVFLGFLYFLEQNAKNNSTSTSMPSKDISSFKIDRPPAGTEKSPNFTTTHGAQSSQKSSSEGINESYRSSQKSSKSSQKRQGAKRSELTKEVQFLLKQLGYNPGPIDGQYGRRTAAAVKAFQRDIGLAQDGRINKDILSAIRRSREKEIKREHKNIFHKNVQPLDPNHEDEALNYYSKAAEQFFFPNRERTELFTALEYIKKAIDLDSTNYNQLDMRAQINFELGFLDAACSDAKKACTLGYCGTLEKFNGKGFCKEIIEKEHINKTVKIPFQPDYNICKLKVLHEGADITVVYDVVTHFKISETIIDTLKGPQAIWIDVQLTMKDQNGMVLATIERTLKADQFDPKFKLKGKYKVNHMPPPVGDNLLCDFKIKNVFMVDPVSP